MEQKTTKSLSALHSTWHQGVPLISTFYITKGKGHDVILPYIISMLLLLNFLCESTWQRQTEERNISFISH